MNEVIEWQGYLGMFDENALMMQTPYIHNDVLVFCLLYTSDAADE